MEKRVSATYVPLQFSLGDMGVSVLGPKLDDVKLDSDMDGVNSVFDRLDGGNLGGRYTCLDLNDNCSPILSPLSAGLVGSVPSGHLSCFRKGFGEDKRVWAIGTCYVWVQCMRILILVVLRLGVFRSLLVWKEESREAGKLNQSLS